ncbi:MAG: pterin-4-alpha-carbinolamine dehydratase [Flavobacteriales bacterium]|nr:pterin-4-alpha-carbinolamine dehydratase [Flavobacteriales bacterium]
MWQEIDNKLVREFRFKDFQEAFTFLTRVAFIAEKANHHPTIINTYSEVILQLSTHDAGDIVTDKDRNLAIAIDEILQ